VPTPTVYTYLLTGIPNSPDVDPGRLEYEIEQSAIIIQIDPDGAILNNNGIVTIKFKDILSAADKTTLDGSASQVEANPAIAGSIMAQNNLHLRLDEPPLEVTVQSGEVTLAANTEVSLAPSTEVTLAGGTEVTLSGGEVTLAEDAQVSLSGGEVSVTSSDEEVVDMLGLVYRELRKLRFLMEMSQDTEVGDDFDFEDER